MTSFITTMFVSRPSPSPSTPNPTSPSSQPMNSFPSPAKPLDSVVTLAQSSSCIHLPLQDGPTAAPRSPAAGGGGAYAAAEQQLPQTPRAAYTSPAHKAIHAVALRSPHSPTSPYTSSSTRFLLGAGMSDTNSAHSNSRTRAPFRPQKAGKGSTNYQLKQFAEATLGSGSLRKAVKLPEGEDKDEWLAVNCVDFYNQINLLYGSVTEFCSPQNCPEMKATDEYEYLWQDDLHYKKPTKMAAPEYVEHLMTWVQAAIDDETLFPSRIGVPFPKTFRPRLTQIFKRLYRVYAHIYCHHYPIVVALGLEPHLNTSFKHYVLFVEEFDLRAGQKDFWGPMGELVENMLKSD